MAEGVDKAAAAFNAVIKADAGKAPRSSPHRRETEGPTDVMFNNLGQLDRDTEPRGGGDDISEEEVLYGRDSSKTPTDSRNPRKEKKKDRDGDDDEPDGDDADEPSDDDAAGDDKPDSDEDDDADDEAEEEENRGSPDLTAKVEVTVDGEPVEVTLKEALDGYVRTETFHRRMNQLDEAKKIIRRAAADAVQNYEYSMNVAKQMDAHMEQMMPKEPDWDEEFKKDPQKARDLQRYYEKANSFRQQLKGQMDEAYKKQAESSQAQLRAFAEEESQKFESMNRKNWSDPKRKEKDLHSMRRTALTAGFTEEELSQVYDSRMLTVLLKASKYDRMMAAKPKPVVRTQGKPIPPGAGSAKQRTAQSGVSTAMKRLNRTGSLEDAAVVMDQIIARG